MQYVVVFEKGTDEYAAYVPDLPGVTAMGHTPEEVSARIGDAIDFRLAAIEAEGKQPPEPSAWTELVGPPENARRLAV